MLWILFSIIAVLFLAALAYPLRRKAFAGGVGAEQMRTVRLAAAAFAGLAPAFALALYLKVGEPEFQAKRNAKPEFDFAAIAALPADQQVAAVENMVARLAERLKSHPDDIDGWRMLIRSSSVLGRAEETAAAFDGLFKATKGEASDWRAYMEVLIALGPQNQNGRDIAGAARKLNALNPDDPLALYFLGDEATAKGDPASAVKYWRRLLALTPDDAPVRPEIERVLRDAEGKLTGPDGLR